MKKEKMQAHIEKLAKSFPGGAKAWSQLAKPGSKNDTLVRDAIEKNPTLKTLVALADAHRITVGELLGEAERAVLQIPVVGIVSAGEGWIPPDDASFEPLEFDVSGSDLIAIEIRGESMFPVYRDGDFLVCSRRRAPRLDGLLNLDCAVMTKRGDGYVKILKRGSKPDRYTLRSYNASYDDIENADLKWAAPVLWVRRSVR